MSDERRQDPNQEGAERHLSGDLPGDLPGHLPPSHEEKGEGLVSYDPLKPIYSLQKGKGRVWTGDMGMGTGRHYGPDRGEGR